jgi:hypothetical protein
MGYTNVSSVCRASGAFATLAPPRGGVGILLFPGVPPLLCSDQVQPAGVSRVGLQRDRRA